MMKNIILMMIIASMTTTTNTVFAQNIAITGMNRDYTAEQLYGFIKLDKPCVLLGDEDSLMMEVTSYSSLVGYMDEKICQNYVNHLVNDLGYKVVVDKYQYTSGGCELEELCYQWILIKSQYYEKYKDKLQVVNN